MEDTFNSHQAFIIVAIFMFAVILCLIGFLMAGYIYNKLGQQLEIDNKTELNRLEDKIADMEDDLRKLLDDSTNKAELLSIRGRWLFYFKYKDSGKDQQPINLTA